MPSLTALRSFEAASRHLSFSQAAHELHVTHGAISRQVAKLEGDLGAMLFIRGPRLLTLTDVGARLARSVGAAFEMIRVASADVRPSPSGSILRLNAPPTLAMWWLMPRLTALHRDHPTLRIELSTSTDPVDFEANLYDIAIRRISRTPLGMQATRFMDGRSIPVCSPVYRKQHRLRSAADLSRATLVVARSEPHAWSTWLAHHDVENDAEQFLTFDQLYFALQAALDSLGVALAPATLVANEVQLGRLVPLADVHGGLSPRYALLAPKVTTNQSAIDTLARWLRDVADNRLRAA